MKLLEDIDAYARAKDPRVRQVSASIAATWQVVEILRADGETYRDIRPLVRLNVSVVAGEGDRQESAATDLAGAKAISVSSSPTPGKAQSTRRSARRWSILRRFPPPPAKWMLCLAPAGPA